MRSWNHCVIVILFIRFSFAIEAGKECGLPTNLLQLPIFAQEEVREIWRAYIPGTSCEHEKLIEADIYDVVNSFDSEATSNNSQDSEDITKKNSRGSLPKPSEFDHIASNGGSPIPLLETPSNPNNKRLSDSDDDYLDQTTFDDVAMMQFDSVNAPFLRTASREVKREFENVWRDDNIPSESLRGLKIQTLAVSLLTAQQLREYSRWATKRKRVLKAREQEMRALSFGAKQTLRKMSSAKARDPGEELVVPVSVKQELTGFVQRLNRRRNLKLVI